MKFATCADILEEIAAAINEQSSGIEEVNKAITETDELTQQNAALADEAAAAIDSLGKHSDELHQMIAFFSTDIRVSAPALASRLKTGLERRSPTIAPGIPTGTTSLARSLI